MKNDKLEKLILCTFKTKNIKNCPMRFSCEKFICFGISGIDHEYFIQAPFQEDCIRVAANNYGCVYFEVKE